MPNPLSDLFLTRLDSRPELLADRSLESIEAVLRDLDCAGRGAWPTVHLDAETFVVHLSDRVRGQLDLNEAIATMHGPDLFLACACVARIPAALIEFERVHLSRVGSFVGRIDPSPAFAEEVAQTMREALLVGARGNAAEICKYSGRGPLSSWLRVIAVRTALRIRRERIRASPMKEAEKEFELSRTVDPELDYLKVRYRAAYEEALKESLRSLPDRDALLLKLHYLDGLSIDSIGTLYGIHRSTVARWRARVRRSVLDGTREQLQRRLSLTESEFDSIVKLVRSQLAVSLRSVLVRPPSETA